MLEGERFWTESPALSIVGYGVFCVSERVYNAHTQPPELAMAMFRYGYGYG